jgi:undecaprenyl-diphosphatase
VNLIQSIILGIVQGTTEILPISSTAHLALLPWFLGWNDPGLAFDASLHLGTLLAIIYYFWRDWILIVKEFVQGVLTSSFENYPNGKTGFFIIVGTIPGALAGLIFEEQAGGMLRNPLIIAATVFVFGIILYLSDRLSKRRRQISEMNILDCLVIGISQAFAIMPGVSRSGITITGGLIRNFKREEAARFSFLLSAPLIAGAVMLESRHLDIGTLTDTAFITGVLTSTVFGFLSIKYLLTYLQKSSYTVFVIYRVLLSALVFLVYMMRAGG